VTPLLDVRDLQVVFATPKGPLYAVDGISFQLDRGEALGMLGESGSGKSVAALTLLRLHPPLARVRVTGSALLDGIDLLTMPEARLRRIRGREIGFVFQDPLTALNPAMTVGAQLSEIVRVNLGRDGSTARRRAAELLDVVGIPNAAGRLDDYPDEFSGGMRQRILIAAAVACEPKLLIADEATTALDPTVQAQILGLLCDLRRELGMAMLVISHDFGVIAATCDRVQVMYAGEVVESGPVGRVLRRSRHPYTTGLIRLAPRFELNKHGRLRPIPGRALPVIGPHCGCPFAPRCDLALDRCVHENPVWIEDTDDVGVSHGAACWRDRDPVAMSALADARSS
jgi:oligopeptide/dipeptide ABC transporter ATP-binding protein